MPTFSLTTPLVLSRTISRYVMDTAEWRPRIRSLFIRLVALDDQSKEVPEEAQPFTFSGEQADAVGNSVAQPGEVLSALLSRATSMALQQKLAARGHQTDIVIEADPAPVEQPPPPIP